MGYKVDGKMIINPDTTLLGGGRSHQEAVMIANKLNWYEQKLEIANLRLGVRVDSEKTILKPSDAESLVEIYLKLKQAIIELERMRPAGGFKELVILNQ